MATAAVLAVAVLARAPRPALARNASACGDVYFLLTTTPDRAARLPLLLETLAAQTLPPKAVVLTVPRRYRRFAATVEVPPHLRRGTPPVLVHSVGADAGPLSKYLGAAAVPPEAAVVVGDDDMFYGPTFMEDYACALRRAPAGTVFSSGLDRDCGALAPCVMGFRGVGLRAGELLALPRMRVPEACFLADDVAVTYFLRRRAGYRVRRMRLRSKYRIDAAFAWGNTSINVYHRARSHRVNRQCAAALLGSGGGEG